MGGFPMSVLRGATWYRTEHEWAPDRLKSANERPRTCGGIRDPHDPRAPLLADSSAWRPNPNVPNQLASVGVNPIAASKPGVAGSNPAGRAS